MFGQAISLFNNLNAGRVTGAPWWRNVRKGLIIKDASYTMANYNKDMLSLYPKLTTAQRMKKALSNGTSFDSSYIVSPASAFQDRYNQLTGTKLTDYNSNDRFMFFMYNPTTWSRTTESGLQQIDIPGGRPVFHQAHIPPQTFTLNLLLDNTVWNTADSLGEELKDHAIGALSAAPRAFGSNANNAGTGQIDDLGLRELQFYHPEDGNDYQNTEFASLAPIINWYERLAIQDDNTKAQPTVVVSYQDIFARCIVKSVTTTILRSDWRQNINRATVDLTFIILYNNKLSRNIEATPKR